MIGYERSILQRLSRSQARKDRGLTHDWITDITKWVWLHFGKLLSVNSLFANDCVFYLHFTQRLNKRQHGDSLQ